MAWDGNVYAVNNGSVTKIGYSKIPQIRTKTVSRNLFKEQSGTKIYISEFSDIARYWEKLTHEKLSDLTLGKECFDINFDDAVFVIKECKPSSNISTIINEGYNAVALYQNVDKMLKEIVSHRIEINSSIDTKIKVVADLIIKAHKREIKKGV